jgi:hypothetical protein
MIAEGLHMLAVHFNQWQTQGFRAALSQLLDRAKRTT